MKPDQRQLKTTQSGGLYSIHIAVFLFGFSGLFGKFLLISPILIVFGRTFFAAATLLPLILYTGLRPASLVDLVPKLKPGNERNENFIFRYAKRLCHGESFIKIITNDCNHRRSQFIVADDDNHAPAMPVYMKVSVTNRNFHALSESLILWANRDDQIVVENGQVCPWQLYQRRILLKKKDLLFYMLQGALLAVHWCSFFYSIQISTVAVGLLTFSTFPLFVTFMEPIFFKEKLIFSDIAAAIAVFAGLVLVLPGFDFSRAPVKGAFWGIFSGLTFAILAIANRKNVEKTRPLVVAFSQNFFAATALLPAIIYLSPEMPGRTDILLLAGLGIICTALAHTLFIKSLIHIKARTAGIITALEPLYGIIFAFFILNEKPGLKTVAGGILIITATTITMSLHKKNS